MNPIEKIQKSKLQKAQNLLSPRKADEEVKSYKNKMESYGFNNKTVKAISNSLTEIEKEKNDIGKKKALDILVESFAPFSVIEYKTLDEVCKDHKLVISEIGNYEKAVPDENLEEIDNFVEKLKSMDKSTLRNFDVKKNNQFTFNNDGYAKMMSNNQWEEVIGTERMFKIAAPKEHFSIPNSYEKIGCEYHNIGVPKAKFTYKPTFHKPTFELDPIVFVTIRFLEKIYCIVVTAWDKEADDSRILSKI